MYKFLRVPGAWPAECVGSGVMGSVGKPRAGHRGISLRAGISVAASAAASAALLAGCSGGPAAPQVAASYLADWSARDWTGMSSLTAGPPDGFTAANAAALTDLGATGVRLSAGR